MKLKNLFIPVLFAVFFQSCFKTDIIHPEAEITEIYNITDTSADFKVVVTSQSNAQYDEIYMIWIDSVEITINSFPPYAEFFYPPVLDSVYIVSVAGLNNNTHYFSRIHYEGIFDIGGPTELKRFLLGEEKEFTTLP